MSVHAHPLPMGSTLPLLLFHYLETHKLHFIKQIYCLHAIINVYAFVTYTILHIFYTYIHILHTLYYIVFLL